MERWPPHTDIMSRPPRDLPAVLRRGPFTTASALALGVPASRLRRSDVRRLRRGVLVWTGATDGGSTVDPALPPRPAAASGADTPWVLASRLTPSEQEILAGVLTAAPDATASHLTAARLTGLWLPTRLAADRTLHVTRPPGTANSAPAGVRMHRRRPTSEGAQLVRGPGPPLDGPIPVTGPARTWRDLASLLDLAELVVLGDRLVCSSGPERADPLCSRAALVQAAARPGQRHAVLARDAAALVRDGAHSPPETRLRLALLDAGLPEPELQLEVWDPAFSRSRPATADLGWRRHGVVLQYEGAGHDDPVQVRRDTLRDAAFQRRGVVVIRAAAADLAEGFRGTTALAEAALRRRGWTPGRE